MKSRFVALACGLLLAVSLSAQLSSNVQLGFVNTFGVNSSFRCIGIGGGLIRPFGDRFALGFSANIYFGGKLNRTDTAHAYSGSTTPQTIEVDVVRKVIAYSGQLELRYYFVGGIEDDMGVYALLGAGALKGAVRIKSVGEYDASKYGFFNTPVVGALSGFESLGPVIGVGYESMVGSVYFFANARFHSPVYSDVDAEAGFAKVPQAITLETGFRFPF